MDYREKYLELLERNKQLENAIKSLRPDGLKSDFSNIGSLTGDDIESPEDFYKQRAFFEKFADIHPSDDAVEDEGERGRK